MALQLYDPDPDFAIDPCMVPTIMLYNLQLYIHYKLVIFYLNRRMTVNINKDRPSVIVRGISLVMMAVIIFTFCGRIGYELSSIQDRSGVIYLTVSIPPMTGILNVATLCMYICYLELLSIREQ